MSGDDEDGAPPIEGSSIGGVVTDFEGVPLAGVRVEAATAGGGDLDLLPAITDGDGRFLLEGLGDGRYDLRFVLGQVKAKTLAVPSGTDQLRIQLARPQGILLVAKVAPGRDEPSVLHVLLERESIHGRVREHFGRSLTRRMLLWSIRPGRYALTVWGGPYLPVEATGIEVREGTPAPQVEMLLSVEGGSIAGVVRRGGKPAESLVGWRKLGLPGPWPRTETTIVSDAAGRFRIQGLPAGRYRVYAGGDRGRIAQSEVDVLEERTTDVELSL